MWSLRNTALTVAAASLLAACTGTQLENSRGMAPQGGAFNAALYQGYIQRSEHEYNYGDYASSDMFAVRARRAANGETVTPLPFEGERIGSEEGHGMLEAKMPEIGQARSDLLAVLDRTARSKAPQEAAEAQVMFDCWLEEAQPDHIAACRSRFMAALNKAQAAVKPQEKAEPAPEPEPEPEPEAATPDNFIVYFGFDSARINEQARGVLKNLAQAAKERPEADIAATGFTDTAGSDDYNQQLSLRRAQAVKDALVEMGVQAERIGLAARGESRTAVETGDGVREPANRRVELSLF